MTLFSVEKLVALPFGDVADYAEPFCTITANTNTVNNNGLSLADCSSIARDLHVIIERCQRALGNATSPAASAKAAGDGVSAVTWFMRLIHQSMLVPCSQQQQQPQMQRGTGVTNNPVHRRFIDSDAHCLKRYRLVLATLLHSLPASAALEPAISMNLLSPDNGGSIACARYAALQVLYAMADDPASKAPIAQVLFDDLFRYIASPPVFYGVVIHNSNNSRDHHQQQPSSSSSSSPSLPPPPPMDEDDHSSRRTAAHIITTAVRGSAPAKQFAIQHQLLQLLTPVIRDTPTGDFFLQLQCLEIVFRVSRAQVSVLDILRLPDMVHSALKNNKLPSDANFVMHLMKLLDTYNVSRQAAHMEEFRQQQQQQQGQGQQQQQAATPCPIFSLLLDGFYVEADMSNPTSAAATNEDPQQKQQCMLRDHKQQDTKAYLSPRLCVVTIPGAFGANITINFNVVQTFKISRDLSVRFLFRTPTRELAQSLGSAEQNAEMLQMTEQVLQRQLMVTLVLQLTADNAAVVRASPLQQWVQAGLDRKKAMKQWLLLSQQHQQQQQRAAEPQKQQQQQEMQTAAKLQAASRVQSRAASNTLPQQQQQQQQHQQPAAALFGVSRDPNQQVNSDYSSGAHQNHHQQQQQQIHCRNNSEDDSAAVLCRFSGGDVPPVAAPPPPRANNNADALRFDATNIFGASAGSNANMQNSNNNNNNNNNSNGKFQVGVSASSSRGVSPLPQQQQHQDPMSMMLMMQQPQQQQQPMMRQSTTAGTGAGATTTTTSGGVGGAFSDMMDGLKNLIGGQINQKRSETADMIAQTVQRIQRRVEEEREKGRRERDDLELLLRQELAALKEESRLQRAQFQQQVSLLNVDVGEMTVLGTELQKELQGMQAELQRAVAECRDGSTQQLVRLKEEVEAALGATNQTLGQLSAENALPLNFVAMLLPQQQPTMFQQQQQQQQPVQFQSNNNNNNNNNSAKRGGRR